VRLLLLCVVESVDDRVLRVPKLPSLVRIIFRRSGDIRVNSVWMRGSTCGVLAAG